MKNGLRKDPNDVRIIHDIGEDPKCAMCPMLAQKVVLYPIYIRLCIHCFMQWLRQQPEGTEIQSQSIIRKHPLWNIGG